MEEDPLGEDFIIEMDSMKNLDEYALILENEMILPPLPKDVWAMISKKLSFKDQLAFRGVCKWFYESILRNAQFKDDIEDHYRSSLIVQYQNTKNLPPKELYSLIRQAYDLKSIRDVSPDLLMKYIKKIWVARYCLGVQHYQLAQMAKNFNLELDSTLNSHFFALMAMVKLLPTKEYAIISTAIGSISAISMIGLLVYSKSVWDMERICTLPSFCQNIITFPRENLTWEKIYFYSMYYGANDFVNNNFNCVHNWELTNGGNFVFQVFGGSLFPSLLIAFIILKYGNNKINLKEMNNQISKSNFTKGMIYFGSSTLALGLSIISPYAIYLVFKGLITQQTQDALQNIGNLTLDGFRNLTQSSVSSSWCAMIEGDHSMVISIGNWAKNLSMFNCTDEYYLELTRGCYHNFSFSKSCQAVVNPWLNGDFQGIHYEVLDSSFSGFIRQLMAFSPIGFTGFFMGCYLYYFLYEMIFGTC